MFALPECESQFCGHPQQSCSLPNDQTPQDCQSPLVGAGPKPGRDFDWSTSSVQSVPSFPMTSRQVCLEILILLLWVIQKLVDGLVIRLFTFEVYSLSDFLLESSGDLLE
jgi:hypothetical protein